MGGSQDEAADAALCHHQDRVGERWPSLPLLQLPAVDVTEQADGNVGAQGYGAKRRAGSRPHGTDIAGAKYRGPKPSVRFARGLTTRIAWHQQASRSRVLTKFGCAESSTKREVECQMSTGRSEKEVDDREGGKLNE
jgi:hypothetical protein